MAGIRALLLIFIQQNQAMEKIFKENRDTSTDAHQLVSFKLNMPKILRKSFEIIEDE